MILVIFMRIENLKYYILFIKNMYSVYIFYCFLEFDLT